jgi:hypothetical protein
VHPVPGGGVQERGYLVRSPHHGFGPPPRWKLHARARIERNQPLFHGGVERGPQGGEDPVHGRVAAEGNFFRRQAFRYWRPAEPWPDGRARVDCEGQPVILQDCWLFGTVDVAASAKASADYPVIALWAATPSGDLILLDREREHAGQHDHFALARRLFARWGQVQLYVEHGFFATTLIADARAGGIDPMTADYG